MMPFKHLSLFFDSRLWIKLIRESITETLSEVEDLQQDQFSYGLKSTGELIRPELRNEEYAKKKRNNAPLYTPDLKNTGDFYSKIQAKLQAKFIDITSTDKKTDKLEDKYGDDIFPLSEEYINKYTILLLPFIQDNLNTWLQSHLVKLQ